MYFENIFQGKENLWQFNDFAKSAQIIHFRKFEHNKICMKIINIYNICLWTLGKGEKLPQNKYMSAI